MFEALPHLRPRVHAGAVEGEVEAVHATPPVLVVEEHHQEEDAEECILQGVAKRLVNFKSLYLTHF